MHISDGEWAEAAGRAESWGEGHLCGQKQEKNRTFFDENFVSHFDMYFDQKY